jgi:Ca2+-binding EF-hand superfamily protein
LLLVNLLDEEDLKKSKDTFRAIDRDHSGLISSHELRSAFKQVSEEALNDEQIEEIIKKLDYDKNGEINYSEFLSGTISDIHLTEHNLYQLFKSLDVYN